MEPSIRTAMGSCPMFILSPTKLEFYEWEDESGRTAGGKSEAPKWADTSVIQCLDTYQCRWSFFAIMNVLSCSLFYSLLFSLYLSHTYTDTHLAMISAHRTVVLTSAHTRWPFWGLYPFICAVCTLLTLMRPEITYGAGKAVVSHKEQRIHIRWPLGLHLQPCPCKAPTISLWACFETAPLLVKRGWLFNIIRDGYEN